ncbi:MAG: hypothetical protein P8R42_23805 [Candidatus Binatia bacterium]|nr:hypothetical protein [Candidatus Binatia bacterium]
MRFARRLLVAVEALNAGPTSDVTVDLSECGYLDSMFPGCLLDLHAKFNAASRQRVRVAGSDDKLHKLFRPSGLGRMVLTSSDAYDILPPAMLRSLALAARVPGGIATLAQTMRIHALRRLPFALGWLAKHEIDDAIVDGYIRPLQEDADVRRDLIKVLLGLDTAHAREAAACSICCEERSSRSRSKGLWSNSCVKRAA